MTATVAYCGIEDLQLGNLPIQTQVDQVAYIKAAAEEIDGRLGLLFVTPVVTDDSPTQRPLKVLLKQVNSQLATGRIIAAVSIGSEGETVNAYASMLIAGAIDCLNKLASGGYDLPGLSPINPSAVQGPLLHNQDSQSLVDSFYTMSSPTGLAVKQPRYAIPWRR